MKTKTVRAFIAHAKSDGDTYLETVREKVKLTLENAAIAQGKAVVIECVLGRDDHMENFKRAGSWDAWAHDVIDRLDYVTRDPVYAVVIVTGRLVGKATAQIIERAFGAQRPILLFCDDAILRPVRAINHTSADFAAGWEVVAS
jgi:hypothetical protein